MLNALVPKIVCCEFINKPAHLVAGKKILNTLAPKVKGGV